MSEYFISDVTVKLSPAFLELSRTPVPFRSQLYMLCYCSARASISEKHRLYRGQEV